jgi:hypothetical protein
MWAWGGLICIKPYNRSLMHTMQAMPMDHKCPWAFVVNAHEYDHHGHVVMNHDQSVEV